MVAVCYAVGRQCPVGRRVSAARDRSGSAKSSLGMGRDCRVPAEARSVMGPRRRGAERERIVLRRQRADGEWRRSAEQR